MHFLALISSISLFAFFLLETLDLHSFQEESFVELASEKEWILPPGEQRNIVLLFDIRKGYHIQANKVFDDNLIPTILTVKHNEAFVTESPIFPEAKTFYLKNVPDPMLVFHDQLNITLRVRTAAKIKSGFYAIHGNLHYQACDSIKCYFPRDLDFNIRIKVP